MTKEIPRRIRIDKLTPAEFAIWEAMQAVENLEPHPLLTEAIILLQQAREKVADFVDKDDRSQQKSPTRNPVGDTFTTSITENHRYETFQF